MRNYNHIDRYLNKLVDDIYEQPEDTGHTSATQKLVDEWISRLVGVETVLDVGCGTGFLQGMIPDKKYLGVCLGNDYKVALDAGRNVIQADYSFLDFEDNSFDLVVSRHSLEHSPMPLLTLMEWHRVAKTFLCLVVPATEWYGYGGLNHYYVLERGQWEVLIRRSGWEIIWDKVIQMPDADKRPKTNEYWYMCQKR